MEFATQIPGAITGRAGEAQDLVDSLERDDPVRPRAEVLAVKLKKLALRAGDVDPVVADAQRVLGRVVTIGRRGGGRR